jgi:NAD(P)-dependent dehydrogenase (short-subunit alcohol dehydrogenase family)
MAGRLEGRKAIVTGAASGIGKASAALFASEGAAVLAIDLPEKSLVAPNGGYMLEIDITGEDAPQRIADTATAKLGGIDILFNNAGISGRWKIEEMTDAQWDRMQAVNLRAPMRITRAALHELKKSRAGRIINTASVMAEVTDIGLSAYCAPNAGARTRQVWRHRQLHPSRRHPHRHDLRALGRTPGHRRDLGEEIPAAPPRRARGHGPGRALPGFGRCTVRHRPRTGGGRRPDAAVLRRRAAAGY